MTVVFYDQTKVTVSDDESVLDGLLKNNINVNYGCKNGVCQSCMMQATDGTIPNQAQKGLTEMQIKQGYFLACQCHPTEELFISSEEVGQPLIDGVVVSKELLSPSIIQLKIKADLDFQPGQFVNLKNSQGIMRSYSIASLPEEGVLEFHIKHIQDGAFSHWVKESLNVNDTLQLQGPQGECYLKTKDNNTPLLLAAMNTGLAPVLGILKQALSSNHTGPISLFIGAKDLSGHYLLDEVAELSEQNENVQLHRVCLEGSSSDSNIKEADIYQTIKEELSSTKDHQVYLCGAESFVKKLKKQCFLAGANMSDIFADAFVAAS